MGDFNPWTGHGSPYKPTDSINCYTGYATHSYVTANPPQILAVLGLATDSDLDPVSNIFKIMPLAFAGNILYSSYQAGNRFMRSFLCPDIHKWSGTEPNEASCVAHLMPPIGTNGSGTTLAQAMDDITMYNSLTVSDTSGLPAQGTVVVGAEAISYSGLSGGNTLTGCTRGANGTTKIRHFIGDTLKIATWFLKINNGALCWGASAPE